MLTVVVLLAGCSSSDSPAAVTVGSETESRATIDGDLKAISTNSVLKDRVVTNGKLDPAAAAVWLSALVGTMVAQPAVEKAKGDISSEDRADALNRLREFFGSDAAFKAMPDSFQARALQQFGFVSAYVRLRTKRPTEADLRKAYDGSLARNCASRRYVSQIISPTEELSRAAATDLAGGTSFSQVAQRLSTDKASAQRGGALGCLDGQQSVDATLAATAAATPIGQVSQPFSTSAGWQIIKVEDVGTVLAYDKVKSEIRSELQYGAAARAKLKKAVATAKVKIDPKYGRWVVTKGDGRVEAPKSAATTTTTQAGSTTTTTP